VKSGGGFAGGGFGAVGALEGMAAAVVLNALTTRKTITTVIRVQAVTAELFLLSTQQTPEQVRMDMSHQLAAIRAARSPAAGQPGPAAQVEQLTRLASMLESGLLTREEFDTLKARLLSQA
jgi:Short C-terminal domain